MFGRLALPVARRALCSSESAISNARRAYHPPANYREPTMNELPIPAGSWKSDNEARQRKYNLHLIAGVSILAFTVGFVAKSGVIEFNFSQPKLED